ncbi:hypothetical protein [Gordonia sp. ABSL49_1]|uniref:hypothetical protein n=1 Tax=Gordonia sp. ABSL49_1 TaxID=2920941 RepID=UPI001F0EB408|nr:hypothetical protein [Gordonia sp. ABSL49_1]MCH5645145.1 hypothetical protein [Gordonia sp. ABSL49_1]
MRIVNRVPALRKPRPRYATGGIIPRGTGPHPDPTLHITECIITADGKCCRRDAPHLIEVRRHASFVGGESLIQRINNETETRR